MVSIRDAVPGDALEVAGVHVRAWQAAYGGLLDQDYLDSLRAEDRVARYTFGSTDPARTYVRFASGRAGKINTWIASHSSNFWVKACRSPRSAGESAYMKQRSVTGYRSMDYRP